MKLNQVIIITFFKNFHFTDRSRSLADGFKPQSKHGVSRQSNRSKAQIQEEKKL